MATAMPDDDRTPYAMTLYGLRGITHGWGRLMSVMSPSGAKAVLAALDGGNDVEVVARPAQPVQLHQLRAGALDALVARHGIVELDQAAWATRKQALGKDAVL